MHLPILFPSDPGCTSCDLHLSAKNPGVPSRLFSSPPSPTPSTPVLIFIGMNPGLNEDTQNTCFIGKSGEVLASCYLPHLTPLAHIYLTNAARCVTPKSKPSARHYNTCIPLHLLPDLHSIFLAHPTSPIHIVTLGLDILKPLSKHVHPSPDFGSLSKALRKNGQPFSILGRTFTFWATYHPAFLLRNQNMIHPVLNHLTPLVRTLSGHLPTQTPLTLVPPFPPSSSPSSSPSPAP